jgi:hypothetical protein
MMTQIALPEQVAFTETGLDIKPGLAFDEWESLGHTLGRMEKAVQWWIGDWCNYGEAQARDATGLAYQTLRTYAWTSRQVSIRMDKVPFGHHQLVAPLPADEQEAALNYAAENELTQSQFRTYLRGGSVTPINRTPEAETATERLVREFFEHMDAAYDLTQKANERKRAARLALRQAIDLGATREDLLAAGIDPVLADHALAA